MKRLLSVLLLVSLFCALFCGCKQNTDLKKDFLLSLTTSNGETIETSDKELKKLEEENPVTFKDKYDGAKITFTDEITSIRDTFRDGSYLTSMWGSMVPEFQEIEFKHGLTLRIISGSHNGVIKSIKVGDTLKIVSKLSVGGFDLEVGDYHYFNGTWKDESSIEIVG